MSRMTYTHPVRARANLRSLFVALTVVVVAMGVLPGIGAAQQSVVANDINGDGAGDLLVGVPLEGVRGHSRGGVVNAIFSNGSRLRAAGNRVLSQAGPMPDAVEEDDLFGSAVELVDINGDGFADAVIGSSGESEELERAAGMFHVVNGSRSGLDISTAVAYRQGRDGLPDAAEFEDFFGFNIGSGDFNGDGYGDVAVTAPFEDVAGVGDAGGVMVALGSAAGLDTSTARFFSQAGAVASRVQSGDLFGWAVTTGDFNGDGFDDLAVGTPGEDVRTRVDAGAVNVLYGSAEGITVVGNQLFSQAGKIRGRPQADDLFGWAVAATDVNCDSIDDLVVGVPNEPVSGTNPAGAVHVILGRPGGLRTVGNVRLHQGLDRVAGQVGFNQFGAAVAAGDFDGDGCGDIAVGAYTTDVGGDGQTVCGVDPDCHFEAGAVVVVYGADTWPRPSGSARFSQRGPVAGVPQRQDFFGRTLAVVDANGDGRDELVVGVPGEDIGDASDAGAVVVLRGSRTGLTSDRSYAFSQRGKIRGVPEDNDQFSSALFASSS